MGQYMTADAAAAELEANPPATFPSAGSYVLAALVPIIGVVLAIVALAKNKIGPGLALALESVVAAYVWVFVVVAIIASQGA